MAFMKLVATQAISVRIERRSLPKLFQTGPGLLSEGFIRVLVHSFHKQAHARALGKTWLMVRLENAILERRREYFDHGYTYLMTNPVNCSHERLASTTPPQKRHSFLQRLAFKSPAESQRSACLRPNGLFLPILGGSGAL